MNSELKDLYGRRTTPVVKLVILVVLIILGLLLVFAEAKPADSSSANKTIGHKANLVWALSGHQEGNTQSKGNMFNINEEI